MTKEQIVFWISKFKYGNITDPDYRRSLIDIFVNSIFLYDDKLVITFNWKNGAKTVTLAEIENAINDKDNSDETETISQINSTWGSHLDYSSPPVSNASKLAGFLAFLFFADFCHILGEKCLNPRFCP